MGYEMVKASEEDFGGKVPAQFAAEGALDGDRLELKLGMVNWALLVSGI
jgi:hypothetical protein